MLADMNETERDAFEEHYFGCAICAEDVRTLDALREGARGIAPAQATPSRRRSLMPIALPWVAAVALVFLSGYQQLVRIPRLAASIPPPVVAVQQDLVLTSETRAEGDSKTLRANTPAMLSIDVVHDPQFGSYGYEVRRGAEVLAEGTVAAEQIQTASLSLFVRPLPAGNYEVVIEGVRKEGNRSEITRYPFKVR